VTAQSQTWELKTSQQIAPVGMCSGAHAPLPGSLTRPNKESDAIASHWGQELVTFGSISMGSNIGSWPEGVPP